LVSAAVVPLSICCLILLNPGARTLCACSSYSITSSRGGARFV
jgi:hypothetical protein